MESGEASANFSEESNDLDFNSWLSERENRQVYLTNMSPTCDQNYIEITLHKRVTTCHQY